MTTSAMTYNGERDILRLKLSIEGPFIDRFVICESRTTFSGRPKPLYFFRDQRYFKPWWHMIEHLVTDDWSDSDIIQRGKESGLVSNQHFARAFYQKEYIQKALTHLKDDDIVYYSDVDEIAAQQHGVTEPRKLEQLMYTYHLDRRSSEPWARAIVARYKDIKSIGLNVLRATCTNIVPNGGWHFSNMGGLEAMRTKLNSYDHQEVNTPEVQAALEERMRNGIDFLGRDFKTWISEEEWPPFLVKNREKYAHLMSGN